MLLDYVPRDVNDQHLQTLFERDGETYGQPSLFARALAHNPSVLEARQRYVAELTSTGTFSDREIELIYVTVATANQCEYCFDSHTDRLTTQFDLEEETIDTIAKRTENVDAAALTEREWTIVSVVDMIATEPKRLSNRDIDRLRQLDIGEAGIIELVVLASAAISATVIADCLNIHPSDGNLLDDFES